MTMPHDPDGVHDLPADARFPGLRELRRHHAGVLGYLERRAPVKFIIDPRSGQIIMPVEPGFAKAPATDPDQPPEFILYCPDESDCVLHLSLQPTEIPRPEAVECVDRWIGSHGPTSRTTWVRCRIEGGKTDTHVFDTDDLQLPNPLGRAEYPLIRHANTDRDRLGAACKAHAAMLVSDPQCVGVDPLGIDVKARFGIIRLDFAPGIYADTPEAAQRELIRLIGRIEK